MGQLRDFILGRGETTQISQFNSVSELCEGAVVTEGRHLTGQKSSCFAHLLLG